MLLIALVFIYSYIAIDRYNSHRMFIVGKIPKEYRVSMIDKYISNLNFSEDNERQLDIVDENIREGVFG